MQAPKGATQSAGVVVEQSSGCLYVKVYLAFSACKTCSEAQKCKIQ